MIAAYREDLVHYGAVYMRRWVLRVRGLGEIRLHHTRTPDGAREHLHDHPWPFMSMLLWGWYTHRVQRQPPHGEVVLERRRWLSVCILRRPAAHVITDVSPRGAWTLVLVPVARKVGDRQASWGFWVDGARVPARLYFRMHPETEQFGSSIRSYVGRER